jgi:hypothetical protein
MKKSVILPKVDLVQGFRPQPIGLNGQPRQPGSMLIPTVQAWQTSTVLRLLPATLPFGRVFIVKVSLNDNEHSPE